jgi:PQQ-like domain
VAKLSPLAYRYVVVESKTMSKAHSLEASHRICRIGTVVGTLGATLLALAACNDLSPDVGTLRSPSACTETVSAPTPSHPYGATVVTCPDGGDTDGNTNGVNVVEAGAGVIGNVLIADQLNNRVIIVDRAGNLLWQFGNGSGSPGQRSVVAPNDAEYVSRPSGDEVLIPGTGGPGLPADDRVLIVDYATGVPVWEYGGHEDDTGLGTSSSVRFGSDKLKGPTSARLVPTSKGDHILISDQGNGRVVEVERATGNVFWQYAQTGLSPQSAERLSDGHTLITDQGNGKAGGGHILEVLGTTSPAVFWKFPGASAGSSTGLSNPGYASRFAEGKTLIADTNNSRVIVVESDKVTWTYQAPESGKPTGAVRLANGHTLIALTTQNLVIEVDATQNQNVVYMHGGGPGMIGNELNGPYNAKVTDDYTGLTVPFLDGGTTGDL